MARHPDEPGAGAEDDFAEGEARRARPRTGRVKAIGNVEIPQAEDEPGRERAGQRPAPSGPLADRGFLAILKVEG